MNKSKRLLTPKQEKLLVFMAEFKHDNQRPATIYEMAAYMGTTVSAVCVKLESLQRKKITY